MGVNQDSEAIDPATRIEMLRTMQRIRAFEERAKELFADGELHSTVHLYTGQEAIAAGVCALLDEDDSITSTHRGHGHCIAKGHELDRMMAELYGKATGYCGGKGGSMHIASPELGNLGANGIVAGGIPIGVGAALSSELYGDGEVGVSFFGDGATAQGAFHEAMNLAAVWDLPFVGVLENNKWGEMTSIEVQQSVTDLTKRAEAYGIPGIDVDGMDVEAVYAAAAAAIDRARAGHGPTLLVCDTYRFEGHYEGDDMAYRQDEELDRWQARDPLDTYPDQLIEAGVISEADWETMQQDIQEELEGAVEFAQESEYPEPEAAYDGVFAEEV